MTVRSLATASSLPVGEVECGAEVPPDVVRRATPGHPFIDVLAGPDTGIVEAALDGGPFTATDRFHAFRRTLPYPRTGLWATRFQEVARQTEQCRYRISST